ncbi:MAG: hypothetical protein AMXMBFR66_14870 [Pseudomonadota bacterium]|nr:DUF2156 domain-containing protein [Rubrivivax sp.]NLZ41865.1 DUF2156 domain-containing protein [Comamonadaceae bacterium]
MTDPSAAVRPACDTGVPLTQALRAEIAPLIERLAAGAGPERLSEHSFTNLLLFRRAHGYRYVAGELPHILGSTYDGVPHLMPLVAPRPDVLEALRHAVPAGGCFYPIADWQLPVAAGAGCEARSLAADADYLYPAANFLHYRGALLHKKRNPMRRLLARHTLHAVPYAAPLRAAAREVLAAWMQDKGLERGGADELECLQALDAAEELGLAGHLHCVDGVPAGFVLGERLAAGVYVIRFAKGRAGHTGIYPYMFHHFCAAAGESVSWLNFEQDLGRPNLRRTKQSYKPGRLLPKWRLWPSGTAPPARDAGPQAQQIEGPLPSRAASCG